MQAAHLVFSARAVQPLPPPSPLHSTESSFACLKILRTAEIRNPPKKDQTLKRERGGGLREEINHGASNFVISSPNMLSHHVLAGVVSPKPASRRGGDIAEGPGSKPREGGERYGQIVGKTLLIRRRKTGFISISAGRDSPNKKMDAGPAAPVEHELRASCDRCWSKKRRCPGGNPCLRCRRGSFVCNYSRKRKLGRPPGSFSNSSDLKRKQRHGATTTPERHQQQSQQQQQPLEKAEEEEGEGEERQQEDSAQGGRETQGHGGSGMMKSPSFVCSSATGLAGLPESRFLSCFLEHYAPM